MPHGFNNFQKRGGGVIPGKKEKEMKEIVTNFQEIMERRDAVRQKVKQATEATEAARNEEAVKRNLGDTKKSENGIRDGARQETEKQFQQPTEILLQNISNDFTPLMA